jgi:hypothetical protein
MMRAKKMPGTSSELDAGQRDYHNAPSTRQHSTPTRNRILPLPRPRIERERGGEGTLVILSNGHGWLCGDRRQALREFAGLVDIKRRGSTT